MVDGSTKPEEASSLNARIEKWSAKRSVQIALATALALAHLLAFARAGHSRLNIPFDLAPGAHLQFTDPRAPSLGPMPRQPPHWSRLVVSRFDAQHYIGTALRGLSACPTDPKRANGWAYLSCGLGWLPAYGAAGGVVSKVTGSSPTSRSSRSPSCARSSSTCFGSVRR